MNAGEMAATKEITKEITRLLTMAERRSVWGPIGVAVSHVAGIAWRLAEDQRRLTEDQQRHASWAAGEIERLEHRISALEARR